MESTPRVKNIEDVFIGKIVAEMAMAWTLEIFYRLRITYRVSNTIYSSI